MCAGLVFMPIRTSFSSAEMLFSRWKQREIPQNHYSEVEVQIPVEMAGGEMSGRKMAGRIVGVLGPKSRMSVSFRFAVSQPMGAIPSDDGTGADSCGSIFA